MSEHGMNKKYSKIAILGKSTEKVVSSYDPLKFLRNRRFLENMVRETSEINETQLTVGTDVPF